MKTCKKCNQELNPTEFAKDSRTYDKLSKRCLSCKEKDEKASQTRRQRFYRENKGKDRRKEWLKYFYNITVDQYYDMLEKQQHSCKICGSKEDGTKKTTLCVDHCHTTGAVRGLLCHSCNTALGHFKDSTEILQKAVEYLNENRS